MNSHPTKILIVDDVMINLVILEKMLNNQEADIYRALSGEEAIELMGIHEFALVLLDVHMPGMDGFSTMEKMGEIYPDRIVPVILITATITDVINVLHGYEKGAVDYLIKPLNPVIVQKKVQVFIELNRQKKNLENLASELKKEIIQRKATEKELRENKHKFESLSQNSPDIIYTLDKLGRITYVNPAWKEIMGHSPEEITGKEFTEFANPKEIIKLRKIFKQIRDNKKTFRDVTGEMIHKDGSTRHFILSGAPNCSANDLTPGMVGLLKDITIQQKFQNQLMHAQKMEAIGNMAGGVAHDFNNLLQAIQGYAELLLLGKSEEAPHFQEISEIRKASQRGAALTKQLLTFSRKAEINFRPVHLNIETENIYRLLLRIIPKMIEIKLVLANDIHYINADPGRIEQILMNLGVNARDAIQDSGQIRITTKNITLDENFCKINNGSIPGDYVLLEVSDTGEGIPEDVAEHIFEPFFTTKQAGKGTGLGLAIVYGIVKNHKGYITCSSTADSGTTFRMYFPSVKNFEEKTNACEEEKFVNGNETILIVDDEEQILEIGARVLKKFGYNVLTASNGLEAINIYKKDYRDIDIVILDMIMPKMSGKQCLREIVKIRPDASVIISSGFSVERSDEPDITKLIKGYIHKPYEVKNFLSTVRGIIDEKKSASCNSPNLEKTSQAAAIKCLLRE